MAKPPRSFTRLVVLPFVLMTALLPMGCASTRSAGAGSSSQDEIYRELYRPGRTVGTG